eukprot:1656511-Pyramimonas_sp.AAC.1
MARGFERSPTAPRFFWRGELPCLVEVHMGDMHGAAPGVAGPGFALGLGRDAEVKWMGLQGDCSDCEFLKRRR